MEFFFDSLLIIFKGSREEGNSFRCPCGAPL